MSTDAQRLAWEKRAVSIVLNDKGYPYYNKGYVKREIVDGVIVETMPHKDREDFYAGIKV